MRKRILAISNLPAFNGVRLYHGFLLGCFLVAFVFSNKAISQETCYDCSVDSLVQVLGKNPSPVQKIKLLKWLTDATLDQTEVSIPYLNQLIPLLQKQHDSDAATFIDIRTGLQYYQKKDYEKALSVLKEAINGLDKKHRVIVGLLSFIRIIYNESNLQEERFRFYKEKLEYYLINGPVENTAMCYHGLAGYYNYMADFNMSISNYLKAAEVFKKFSVQWYNNEIGVIGSTYSDWGNREKATYYLHLALPLFKAAKDSDNAAFCLNGLAQLALSKGDVSLAMDYADEAFSFITKKASALYPITLLQKALILLEKNSPAQAYPLMSKAKNLVDSLHLQIFSSFGYLETDFAYYKYFFETHHYKLAEAYLLSAYHSASKETINKLELKYLKELSFFYEVQHNPPLALKYMKQYDELNERIEEHLNKFKVAEYENEQKEVAQNERIHALKEEKSIQEATIRQRNVILWISLAAILLICASVIFLYRQLTINKKTLRSLRQTQRQLIMAEKMASLGELTAGVAHEIQNPLNFVNNFSEVSTELVDEMQEALLKDDKEEAIAIAMDVKENLDKINHHGKRADAIVKGMLEHARASTGKKEPTDINALADEYLRLSYHGLRAKDKSFNANFRTNFDERIGKIELAAQDMGRVLLNLYNNAFYAVNEKKKQSSQPFEPLVEVSTKMIGSRVELTVKDNGTGIPQKVVDKIFQPFFTTKPAGQGTGLGLSISYDIIKAHGGELSVETNEGKTTIFVVVLPML